MIGRCRSPALIVLFALTSAAAFAQSPRLGQPQKPGQPGKPAKPAASKEKAQAEPDPAPAPAPEPPPPPYEPRLLRLSEILGTLAYMRDICGAGDGDEWRKRMSALIEAEADTQPRKERLAGAFNRGFRGYQMTYRSCTASARAIIERALEEGEKVTREMASRYAG